MSTHEVMVCFALSRDVVLGNSFSIVRAFTFLYFGFTWRLSGSPKYHSYTKMFALSTRLSFAGAAPQALDTGPTRIFPSGTWHRRLLQLKLTVTESGNSDGNQLPCLDARVQIPSLTAEFICIFHFHKNILIHNQRVVMVFLS